MKTCGLTEVQSTQASHQNASNNSVVNENMAQMGDYPWTALPTFFSAKTGQKISKRGPKDIFDGLL
jgi:hypothetical protein